MLKWDYQYMLKLSQITQKQKNTTAIVIAVIIIILVIIFATGSGNSDGSKKEKKNKNDVSETTSVSEMKPVIDGDFQYSFSGIRWNYTPNQDGESRVAETKVGFFLNDFTRYPGGKAATFARPFHISWYEGDCTMKTDTKNDERISSLGTPVGFSECIAEGIATTLGIFQDERDLNVYAWTDTQAPELVRTIDMGAIVNVASDTDSTPDIIVIDNDGNPTLLKRK